MDLALFGLLCGGIALKSFCQGPHDKSEKLVGSRGQRLLTDPLPYLVAYFGTQNNKYNDSNLDGYVSLAVSENILGFDMIRQDLLREHEYTDDIAIYRDFTGSIEFRTCIARFMQRSFISGCLIDPQDIIVQAGCGCILSSVAFALFEPGDAILIPAPYYPGFDNIFNAIAQVTIIPVHLDGPEYKVTRIKLNEAMRSARGCGLRVKGIVISHPWNPIGRMMLPEELDDVVQFTRFNSLHLISDEIYALSTFEANFESLATRLHGDLGNNIHLVWGLSKDFNCSGFRVGCLWSKNQPLLNSMRKMSFAGSISNTMQESVAAVLHNNSTSTLFIPENRSLLFSAYQEVVNLFCSIDGILAPICDSGMFLWVDMCGFFEKKYGRKLVTFADEFVLFCALRDECRVIFTPGESCHAPTPGCFRICYASVPTQHLQVAADRVVKFSNGQALFSAASK